MRDTPNFDDAKFALKLYELRRETELRKARNMIGELLDGAPWDAVERVMQWGHKENAHFRQATSYWEMVASFVNRGIFHPDVYLDTCGEGLYTFSVLKNARVAASLRAATLSLEPGATLSGDLRIGPDQVPEAQLLLAPPGP